MKKAFLIIAIIIAIVIVVTVGLNLNAKDSQELLTIKSEKQLLSIYEGEDVEINNWLLKAAGMPLTALIEIEGNFSRNGIKYSSGILNESVDGIGINSKTYDSGVMAASNSRENTKDYSTTNIQVENVDEADITKTDGDYIYSISENQVIITDVKNPKEPKIATRINGRDSSYPEDLILNNNKLIVISQNGNQSYYSNNRNTLVSVYDISNKETPILQKGYELYEPYYTSRCINNKLYVISSGNLRKENNNIVRKYKENNVEKNIGLDSIKYLKDIKTSKQTIFSSIDLENIEKDVNIKSYLIDISNAYVSEKNFYLLDEEYEYGEKDVPSVKSIFGLKGIFGFFDEIYKDYRYDYDDYGYKTKIYKFNIKDDGSIEYAAKTKTEGKTINQYSLDERAGHLRVALYDTNKGSKIAIFDEKLNKIGQTNELAKGEKMYSSRFIGDRAYLVTYRTIDPLWVIDLSNENNPTVLGELHIPGYSTYLHPYDETHLIGIGMETKETTNRDSLGRVLSTSARIVGMKMALFDVTNVTNPTQISATVIGDSRTTSSILTNPKALLFSKEKELIAIPVNRYNADFEVTNTSDEYSSIISSYKNKSTNYVGEGYLVYKINLTEGFKQKGLITHEKNKTTNPYSYYYISKMLRGLYIENNLYTVSETALKVNNLEDLKLISEMKIKGE